MASQTKSRWKPEELERHRKSLLLLLARLQGDLDQMTDEALQSNSYQNSQSNLSNAPVHMADIGTESYDLEFTLGLIENEQTVLEEIREALERIEAGNYGRCEGCEKPIAKARLQALPYTRYCIECARREELEEQGHAEA